ncbi:MAG: GIY-YIG nuclease family protein [Clostridia bacterium]
MNFYVYEITNNINGKKYIGKRKCSCNIEDDCYMGSGAALTLAKKKYGGHNFSKKIIEVCNTEDEAYLREAYWINYFDAVKSDDYYNLIEGEKNNKYKNMTNKQREEMNKKKRRTGLYKDFYERKDAAWKVVDRVRYEDAKVILGQDEADKFNSYGFKQWEVAEMYDEIYLYREPEEEYSVDDEYMEMMYDGYSKNDLLYGYSDFYN